VSGPTFFGQRFFGHAFFGRPFFGPKITAQGTGSSGDGVPIIVLSPIEPCEDPELAERRRRFLMLVAAALS